MSALARHSKSRHTLPMHRLAIPALAAAILAANALWAFSAPPAAVATARTFVACHQAQPKAACVYDGDTIWLDGVKIRIAGYDAPEMGAPLCAHRAAKAIAARDRLISLLNSGPVRLGFRAGKSFDRTVAPVLVGGADVARAMIASGLARPYVPGEAPWC